MKKNFLCFIILIFSFLLFSYNSKSNTDIINLKFSTWGSQSEIIILKELILEYEKNNPNIKIELIHIPQNYFQKIHLLFASNLQSDIVFINNLYAPMYIKANLLEDLSKYNINKNNYFDEALQCFSSNNKLYAIPRDISALVIYYNKNIFKENNILNPKIDNIYQLRNIAKKLTDKNHFGLNFEENSLYWAYFLASNGGGILSDNKKNLILDSKESKEAINLYKEMLYKDKSMPSKSQIGSMTTAQMFINQKLAMYISGRWMFPKFQETIHFNWDIMPFPASDKNKVYIDSSGWAISRNSKHKQEALQFITFLSSEDSINKLTKTGLIIPALKSSCNKIHNSSQNSQIFIDLMKYSKPTPVNENYSFINDIINEKIQTFFNSNYTFDEIFNEKTKHKIESLL